MEQVYMLADGLSPSIELHYQIEMDLQFALGRRAEYRFSQSVNMSFGVCHTCACYG